MYSQLIHPRSCTGLALIAMSCLQIRGGGRISIAALYSEQTNKQPNRGRKTSEQMNKQTIKQTNKQIEEEQISVFIGFGYYPMGNAL